MRVIAIEAETCIVYHIAGEDVGPTQSNQLLVPAILGGEVAVTDQGVGSPQRILAIDMAVAIAAENLIARVEVIIDPAVNGVDIVGDAGGKDIVGSTRPATWLTFNSNGSGDIRESGAGHEGHEFLSDWIEAAGLNDVVDVTARLARNGRVA